MMHHSAPHPHVSNRLQSTWSGFVAVIFVPISDQSAGPVSWVQTPAQIWLASNRGHWYLIGRSSPGPRIQPITSVFDQRRPNPTVSTLDFQLKSFPERSLLRSWLIFANVYWLLLETELQTVSELASQPLWPTWKQVRPLSNSLWVWIIVVQTHHMELSWRAHGSPLQDLQELQDLQDLQAVHGPRSSSTTSLSSTSSRRSRTSLSRVSSGPYRCPFLCPTAHTTATLV